MNQLANFQAQRPRVPKPIRPAHLVANNEPLPDDDPARAAWLLPILRAFFPNPVPAQTVDGSTARNRVLDFGEMAYYVWQSGLDLFQNNDTKRNFTDIGRGGAGALVVTGLASSYAVDPQKSALETPDLYFDRIVGELISSVKPGAMLQFWNLASDFENIKNRQVPGNPPAVNQYGHSPIFLDFIKDNNGATVGIRVIDQEGETDCPVHGSAQHGDRTVLWGGAVQQIWIAANWEE
jgi:hypothetical protein